MKQNSTKNKYGIKRIKNIVMFHYIVMDTVNDVVVLDSSLVEGFDGYSTWDKALFAGILKKMENRLPDTHVVFINDVASSEEIV